MLNLRLNDTEATLRKVQEILAAPSIVDVNPDDDMESLTLPDGGFSMSTAASRYDCGTVACIGGWAWLTENPGDFKGANTFVLQVNLDGEPEEDRLYSLFYAHEAAVPLVELTKEEAIVAIDKFLDPSVPAFEIWDHVLPNKGK